MPTSGEKKALCFFAAVALSGSGVRACRGSVVPIEPGDVAALERQITRVDSVRARDMRTPGARSRGRTSRSPAPVDNRGRPATAQSATPIDLDRASEPDIESLPGIGPALAHRIVSYRDSAGAFGELDALCEVPGIGPALAARLRPLVTFTGARRPVTDACGEASNVPRASRGSRSRKLR